MFDPPPTIVREFKFGSDNGGRPSGSNDFNLKTQMIELFESLDSIRDGTVQVLEVKHGLPFRMEIEAPMTHS